MLALAVVTLLGFWEWTQFVNQPSRMLAMIPALLVGGISVALIDFQFPAISNMNTAHFIVLGIGSLWWLVSSGLAITYPRSRPLWEPFARRSDKPILLRWHAGDVWRRDRA
ncbi:phosphatidate cytidylyltransferase domain protein [Vibrio cholerae]|nr:phosphatidate cytidylyltransferase domain protein [Vibrio cholerae]